MYKYKPQKVITFDLDETLGSFGDLYILWDGLQMYIKNNTEPNNEEENPNESMFYMLMDLYPEFLRYGILNILDFLYHKKL
jgi:hypothetical protein